MKKSDIIKVIFIFTVTGFLGYFFEKLVDSFIGSNGTGMSYFGIPFLPLYGVGAVLVYFISKIKTKMWAKVIGSIIAVTFLELVIGMFLLSQNIRLWDYSDHFLNIQGLISLQVSIIWAIFVVLFYFVVLPLIEK